MTAIYKIDRQWEFAVWLRKLKQGWDGEGDGREVLKGGGIYVYEHVIYEHEHLIHVEV